MYDVVAPALDIADRATKLLLRRLRAEQGDRLMQFCVRNVVPSRTRTDFELEDGERDLGLATSARSSGAKNAADHLGYQSIEPARNE